MFLLSTVNTLDGLGVASAQETGHNESSSEVTSSKEDVKERQSPKQQKLRDNVT